MVEAAVTADNTCDTKPLRVGLDIGSTTVKAVVLDQTDSLDAVLFSDYRRHHANVRATVAGLLEDIHKELEARGRGDEPIRLAITGSGGLALADNLHVPFVQEVIAETRAIDEEYPQADVIIELGGEDAKITYLKPTPEQRMNGSCAGGTGAFIDQMATLLDTDAAGLNDMAKHYETLYPIASRCGVFAKTDLQPLINDGAAKPDLAASIFTAVATQTIAGLASGRPIHGTVIFLGGPLFFMSELREAFHRALEGKVDEFIVPTDAHLYVAFGSALLAGEPDQLEEGQHFEARTCADILKSLEDLKNLPANTPTMPPLFPTEADREAFNNRHHREHVHIGTLDGAQGPHFLGIDAGSLEGWFAPDTYHYTSGSADLAVMKQAVAKQKALLAKAWESRSEAAKVKTPYEALTLASIIEKETGLATDRHLVSSVFNNRLSIGMPLQTDPTVIYGLGEKFSGNITRKDLQTPTPYNTYVIPALPPTPIAAPTWASIEAAVNPADTRFLYFVSKGDGSSHFSQSLAEHNRAVRQFILNRPKTQKKAKPKEPQPTKETARSITPV